MNHLIYYDESCPLCQSSIRWIAAHDKKKLFAFSPLALAPPPLQLEASLLFFEYFDTPRQKIWLRGKAIFRILKHLGLPWSFFSFLTYFPGIDLLYRLISRHRMRL